MHQTTKYCFKLTRADENDQKGRARPTTLHQLELNVVKQVIIVRTADRADCQDADRRTAWYYRGLLILAHLFNLCCEGYRGQKLDRYQFIWGSTECIHTDSLFSLIHFNSFQRRTCLFDISISNNDGLQPDWTLLTKSLNIHDKQKNELFTVPS